MTFTTLEIYKNTKYIVKYNDEGSATHVLYPFVPTNDPRCFPFNDVTNSLGGRNSIQFIAIGEELWDQQFSTNTVHKIEDYELPSFQDEEVDGPFLNHFYTPCRSTGICIVGGRYSRTNGDPISVAMLYRESPDPCHVGHAPLEEIQEIVMRKLAGGGSLEDAREEIQTTASDVIHRTYENVCYDFMREVCTLLRATDVKDALAIWAGGKQHLL